MGTLSTSNLAVDLGPIPYGECLDIQMDLVKLRRAGMIGNVLLFLEHDPPVYTIGRKSDPTNWKGLDPVRTDRGGDVTYHGPGQLVVYPIFDISRDGSVDVRSFVKSVEKTVMSALSENEVDSYVGEEPGIWSVKSKKKVASIGMAIDRHISYHGIAINYTRKAVEGFARINPCGLDPSSMGYVEIPREKLVNSLLQQFGKVFSPHRPISRSEFMDLLETLRPQTPQ